VGSVPIRSVKHWSPERCRGWSITPRLGGERQHDDHGVDVATSVKAGRGQAAPCAVDSRHLDTSRISQRAASRSCPGDVGDESAAARDDSIAAAGLCVSTARAE
jgi:hypothetical protein